MRMDAEESDLTAEQAIAATNAVVDAELNALGLDPFRVAGPVSLLHERAKAAFDAVRADRDRLAKRCADLESRLAVANKAEAHSRAQVDAYHDIGATTRLGDVESRLAATDARLTALVEALNGWFQPNRPGDYDTTLDAFRTRLAAFRAAARAEGAAEAIEAVCAKCYVCNGTGRRRTSCSMCGDSTFDHECDDRYVPCKWCAGIRALAPAGLVAVATDDLEWLLSEADTCEMRMPTSNPRLREERDEIVTRVRAALARKEPR